MSLHPLPRPPYDYVSAGSYWTSFHRHHVVSKITDDLDEAIAIFLGPAFGTNNSPDRRVLVDARGVVIFGALNTLSEMVATEEVLDRLSLNHDPGLVEELRLEVLWDLSSSGR